MERDLPYDYLETAAALCAGDQRLQELYLENAAFYHGLNELCAALPAYAEGLAAVAERESAQFVEKLQALMNKPLGPPPGARLA